jgi:hypothetical protein
VVGGNRGNSQSNKQSKNHLKGKKI